MSGAKETVGRFEVEKVLGEGGMGRVVLARDPLLGRRVAVKTLLSPSPAAGLRFAEEAQITGQLAHPNVIPVHSFGQHEGTPFLAMRFVQGRDLKALVKALAKKGEATAYPLRRRLRLFLKVCEAVAHAHERGVIHRDLKPANVMLGDDDEVLVMDWGLARPIGATDEHGSTRTPAARVKAIQSAARAGGADLTMEGAVVGTPAYMPPEQADESGQLDARADVYSLGALLYELVTHRQPYNGSGLEVIAALITGKPPLPTPRAVAPRHDIPPAVEAIILKAMSREAESRHADAGALAQDIEAFLDDRPVSCHREGAREALARIASRHRLPIAAAGAAVVALAVAAMVAFGVVSARAEAASLQAKAAKDKAKEADDARDRATREGALAGLRADAQAKASSGGRRLAAFADVARTALPTEELKARRDEAVAELVKLDGAVVKLGDAGDVRAATGAARAAIADARTGVDVAYGRALVARRPRLALKLIPPLDAGQEEPLLLARAHARLEQGREALDALAGADWTGRKDLELAARVVSLLAVDAPSEELSPAIDAALLAARGTPWLIAERAQLRVRQGKLDEAEADYERAITLDPVDAYAAGARLLDLVPLYIHEEYYPGAHGGYLHLLSEGENLSAHLHGQLVTIWHYGHHLPPIKDLEGLVAEGKITPLVAARQLATLALVMDRWPDAERAARKALELAKDDRRALGLLAEALVGQGKLDEAKDVADRGLKRHPTDGQLAFARGEAARLSGEPEEAARLLRIAARCSLLPQRWERLARALLALDTPSALEEGVQAMRKGLTYDVFDTWLAAHDSNPLTGDPRYHRVLGDLRRAQGNLAAAVLHYQRSSFLGDAIPRVRERLGLDRTDAMRLGEVHEQMNLPQEAHMFYGMAREDPKLADEAARRMARLEGR